MTEWEKRNYKNNPITYFENTWKSQRYLAHVSNIKMHNLLSTDEQRISSSTSNDLKYQLKLQLRAELNKEGSGFSEDLNMKVNAISLTNNDNKELSNLINQWHESPEKATTTAKEYFFERFSVHKEHFSKQIVKTIGLLDNEFQIDTSRNAKELLNLGKETNYDSRVPNGLIAYGDSLKNGIKHDVVTYIKHYIFNNDNTTNHIDNFVTNKRSNTDLNGLLNGLTSGISPNSNGTYHEETPPKKKKRRLRPS